MSKAVELRLVFQMESRAMNTIDRIFFDMDGVLADFARGVRELAGVPGFTDLEKHTKDEDDAMWEKARGVEHFYLRLDPIAGSLEMLGKVNAAYPGKCEILTGIPKPWRGIASSGEDKIAWMKKFFKESIPVNIVLSEEKPEFCRGAGSVLIDDMRKNIRGWEKAGGTGIRFERGMAGDILNILKMIEEGTYRRGDK